ncbi:intercellular adhesion molecule 2-like isoform X1 [Alligator sinensis]|uniref:Intercellular adhesion molecule 2-like isoform X1 n=1 Tax=Alligator sinensis TaxID=38654 RepID=A0A1U8D4Y4_ALLSI|nr:intercellular adhesion molecule 2-like isoform X1 [Alligator sinensis]
MPADARHPAQVTSHPLPAVMMPWYCSPLLLLSLLLALSVAEAQVEVRISPSNLLVEYGGNLTLTCSSTCPVSDVQLGLETSLTKHQVDQEHSWVLVNISESQSVVQCWIACNGTDKTIASADITTYRVPKQVTLELPPMLEKGKTYPVTCRVVNVAPVRNLSVTLHLGGQVLHTKNFQNYTPMNATNIMATFNVIAEREYHGQDVTCHTALDLRPHGPLLENASTPASLSVYETPARVVLEMTPEMQQGSTYNVTCQVENVGSLQNLSVMLYRGHQILHTKTFSDDLGARPHDKLVTFNMTARRYHQGQNISCHAVLDLDLNGHRLVVEESSPSTSFRVYASSQAQIVALSSIVALVILLVGTGARVLGWRLQAQQREERKTRSLAQRE